MPACSNGGRTISGLPTPEIAIAGCGPAALAAALRLHALGHRAALVVGQPLTASRALETLQNLAVASFAFPGLVVGQAFGISELTGGISWWNGEERELPAGFVVDRALFDRALLALAADRGIETVATPLAPRPDRWMIDASGRRSPWREAQPLVPWRQRALLAVTTQSEMGLPAMWLEALPAGWLWGLRSGAGGRYAVSLFVDEEPGTGAETIQATWWRLLRTSRAWPWLATLTFSDPMQRDVTPLAARTLGGLEPLLIGDAALARDPLAAQGLSAGISDGLAAAAVFNTLALDPGGRGRVREFIAERQRHACTEHLRALGRAYRAVPFDTPFWRRRRELEAPPETTPPVLPDTPLADICWTMSTAWRLRQAPVLDGDRIVLAECLCSPSSEEKFAFFEGRPIRDFFAGLETGARSREILALWTARGLLDEVRGLHVLRWLAARSVLVPCSG